MRLPIRAMRSEVRFEAEKGGVGLGRGEGGGVWKKYAAEPSKTEMRQRESKGDWILKRARGGGGEAEGLVTVTVAETTIVDDMKGAHPSQDLREAQRYGVGYMKFFFFKKRAYWAFRK